MLNWTKALTKPVQLSDDQMKGASAALSQSAKGGDSEATFQELPQVVLHVLTAEQKTIIAKYRASSYINARFGNAALTAEQGKKVATIVDEWVKASHFETDWPEFGSMKQVLREKTDTLLTAEQKIAVKPTATLMFTPTPDKNRAIAP